MKKHLGLCRDKIFLPAIVIGLLLVSPARSQSSVSSTLQLTPGANNWFNAAAWTAGIPNGPGAFAEIRLPTGSSSQLAVGSPVTLEQLLFSGFGSTNLQGVGPIKFLDDGSGELVLQLSPTAGTANVTIAAPLELNASLPLNIEVGSQGLLQLSAAFAAQTGNVVKRGAGDLRLSAANPLWAGSLDVGGGTVVVAHAQSLGTPGSATAIRSGGRLSFLQSSGESLQIDGGGVQVVNLDLTGPVSVMESALIHRPKNPVTIIRGQEFENTLGPTNINGPLSGDGALTLRNESRDALFLRGDNTYTGRTFVSAGAVNAASATALGAAAEGTTVNGEALTIQSPTAETFRIESGSLRFNAGDFMPADTIEVAGGDVFFAIRDVVATPIVVDGLAGAIRGANSTTSFVGGSSGVGNLRVARLKVDAPLTHQGGLILENAALNVANSYTGETIIADTTDFNHAGAFGQSTIVRVQRSELRLNVLPAGAPHFFVESGVLLMPDSPQPFVSPITIGGSSDATLRGNAVYQGPITVIPGLRNQILEGVVNGPITGPGALELGGGPNPVHLNAANSLAGPAQVRGGHVYVNHPQALDLNNTTVNRGTLHVNVPANGHVLTNEDFNDQGAVTFEVAQEFDDPWVLNAGTLTAAAPVGMQRLIAIGGTEPARINGGPWRIDGELTNVFRTNVDATIAGAGDIRNIGHQLGVSGDMSGFTGNLIADRGETIVQPSTANSFNDGAYHVRNDGILQFFGDQFTDDIVVDSDIFLQNAHGSGSPYEAALVHNSYASDLRLRGRLDVGDQGSTTLGNFAIEGQITGRNLTHRGSALTLRSMQDQLGGTLRINGGSLHFENAGALRTVDEVVLENRASLYMTVPGSADRIDDAIDVVSRGSLISLISSPQTPAGETLGILRPERGLTQVFTSSDHGSLNSALTLGSLDRRRGSVVHFFGAGNVSSTRILNHQTQLNGMVGPWAITDQGFAALNASGQIATLASTASSLNGAGPNDHVNFGAAQTLVADTTIGSLRTSFPDTPVNLGGKRLTIASGGIYQASNLTGGEVTAGVDGDAELVVHYGNGPLAANIVDNGAGGHVALVASNGFLRLSGQNSYTGGTWVVGNEDSIYSSSRGQLIIQNYAAIPQNDRVHVGGGIYSLEPLPAGVVHLAELHLRGNGRVTSGLAEIDADQMVLEHGLLYATLVGDGAITKQTDGHVDFSNSQSPNFTGVMTVEEGRVLLQESTLPKAQFRLQGGEVRFSGTGTVPNNFLLDGGTLTGGRITGTIDVQSHSVLRHEGSSRIAGTLRGNGDLTIRGRQHNRFTDSVGLFANATQFTGDVHVESGALRIGAAGSAGAGAIDVQPAGRLILQTNSYTDPPLVVANDVDLFGGTLYSFPPFDNFGSEQAAASILQGDLAVHGEGYIGALRTGIKNGVRSPGLTLAGQVTLDDGAHVFGLSDGRHTLAGGEVALVDVAGQLRVGADTTWHLLSSTLSISGEIRANAPQAAINFVGGPAQLRLSGAEFHADAGQSLAVTINDGAIPVNLDGDGNVLAGQGTLLGDFSIAAGASVAPGASPGILTIDGDAAFGPGGVLDIEIAGAQLGAQYDQLRVSGHAELDGALLQLSLLDGFVPTPEDSFVVLRASSLSGAFANAASSIDIGGLTLPVTYRDNMVIVGNPVPEPAALILLLMGGVAIGRDVAMLRKSLLTGIRRFV